MRVGPRMAAEAGAQAPRARALGRYSERLLQVKAGQATNLAPRLSDKQLLEAYRMVADPELALQLDDEIGTDRQLRVCRHSPRHPIQSYSFGVTRSSPRSYPVVASAIRRDHSWRSPSNRATR